MNGQGSNPRESFGPRSGVSLVPRSNPGTLLTLESIKET